MRVVYIEKIYDQVKIKSNKPCEIRTVEIQHSYGRPRYNYGDLPKNYAEELGEGREGYFNLILSRCYWRDHTFFRDRDYLGSNNGIRIYEDEFISAKRFYEYKVVDNPIIKYLEEDLGFEGYSELVFDREQELKKLTMKV